MGGGTSSSTYFSNPYLGTPKIVNVKINSDCIEIVYKAQKLISTFGSGIDYEVWKEVYGVKEDGTFGLLKKISGTYFPPQDESFEFEEPPMTNTETSTTSDDLVKNKEELDKIISEYYKEENQEESEKLEDLDLPF